jgi:hypothetical protein
VQRELADAAKQRVAAYDQTEAACRARSGLTSESEAYDGERLVQPHCAPPVSRYDVGQTLTEDTLPTEFIGAEVASRSKSQAHSDAMPGQVGYGSLVAGMAFIALGS